MEYSFETETIMYLYIKISSMTKLTSCEHVLHTWFCLLLSCHHVSLPAFSVRHRISKPCMSEVCSQHALCAYMWIMLATEQCSSTWPVSWNIPLCDPSEASHPAVTPLPPPCLDPEECPRGPTDQTIPLTMGLCYSSFHFISEECVVFPL